MVQITDCSYILVTFFNPSVAQYARIVEMSMEMARLSLYFTDYMASLKFKLRFVIWLFIIISFTAVYDIVGEGEIFGINSLYDFLLVFGYKISYTKWAVLDFWILRPLTLI